MKTLSNTPLGVTTVNPYKYEPLQHVEGGSTGTIMRSPTQEHLDTAIGVLQYMEDNPKKAGIWANDTMVKAILKTVRDGLQLACSTSIRKTKKEVKEVNNGNNSYS